MLETYKKSFFPRTIRLWNDLPVDTNPKTVFDPSRNNLLQNIEKYKFSIIMENDDQMFTVQG